MHKHHTHCSVESVTERGAAVPSPSSMSEQVDGLSKLEQRTCAAQGIEDRGHFSRRPEACSSETSSAQYIVYNKMGLFESTCRPAKNDSTVLALTLPLPLPLHKDPHPKPARRGERVMTPSRARISSPLVTTREQRP